MQDKRKDILSLKEILGKIQAGHEVTDKEKVFIKQILSENIKEVIEDIEINFHLELLLISIGEKEFAEFVFENRNNDIEKKEIGTKDTPIIVFKNFGDNDYLKQLILNPKFKFSSEQKERILEEIGDENLIKRFIYDLSLGLNDEYRARLILELCDGSLEELKKYIFDSSLKLKVETIIILLKNINFKDSSEILRNPRLINILDLKERIILASKIGDFSYIKEQVDKKTHLLEKIDLMNLVNNEDFVYEFLKQNVNEKSDFNLLQLIHKIYTPEKLKEFKDIVQKKDKSGELIKHLAENLGDDDFFHNWEKNHIEISHVTELNAKELEENKNIKYVVIKGTINEYYSREDYLNIRKTIDKITEGIPKPKKGDLSSELRAFKMLLKRLAHIRYNYYAISKKGDMDSILARESRNLYGGLIEKTCVCNGYARILEECALCLGFEIVTVGGNINSDTQDGHAWNQIKIGGKWFNCDLTNFRNLVFKNKGRNFFEILQSDDEFLDFDKYYFDKHQNLKPCNTKIKELLLAEYIKHNAHIWGINEINVDARNLRGNLKDLYEILDDERE